MANIDNTEKQLAIDHIETPAEGNTLALGKTPTHQTVDDAIVEQLENGEVVGFTWKTALGCIVRSLSFNSRLTIPD